MKLLKFFGFLITVYPASAFNLRGLINDTLQQQEKGPGIYARITHGFTAQHGWFPYQVCLVKERETGDSIAGGSLVSNKWVLTTAHSTIDAHIIHVYLGQIIPERIYTTIHRPSPKVIEHHGYNATTMLNDIALIKITAVRLTDIISPVKLPKPPPTSYYHISALLAGWGKTSDTSHDHSHHLQYATFRVISDADCAAFYDHASMSEGKLCVEASGSTSGCDGDSGGALVLPDSNIQIGILSFGSDYGCEYGHPMAFTRVDHYLDWIRRKIN